MNKNLKFMVEGAITLALTAVLNSIVVFKMPRGGSISLAGYVPILLFGLRWGLKLGIIIGLMYGILDSFVDPYVIHPIQYLLDYPIAYMALGLSGLGCNEETLNGKINLKMILACVFAVLMRGVAAILSGYVFFKDTLPKDIPALLGSFLYNITYIVPNGIIAIVVILILIKPVSKVSKK